MKLNLKIYKGENTMKNKLITILLLCSLCLAICACNINTPNEVDRNDTTKSDTTETPSNNLPNETEAPDIEMMSLFFYSEDEYTKFLNSNKLPAEFVSYDKIDAMGAFTGLVFLSDAYRNDYSWYMYTLVDSEGVEFVLYVDHRDKALSTESSVTKVDKTNMRLLSDAQRGVYIYDNIEYKYMPSGNLLSISWQAQNVTYCLSKDGPMILSDYPLTESTFVGKLLNTDTAPQALSAVFGEASK